MRPIYWYRKVFYIDKSDKIKMTQTFKQKLISFRFELFSVPGKRTVAGPTTVLIGAKMC